MAKQLEKKSSPFDALRIARIADPPQQQQQPTAAAPSAASAVASDVQTATQPNRPLAKSVDANYVKFTTYVRKKTHLAAKARLVSQERELSDLVEELLEKWLRESPPVEL